MKKLLLIPLTLLMVTQSSFAMPAKHARHHAHQAMSYHQSHVLKSWHHVMRSNKTITRNQARTLTQAAIILYGDEHTQIKSIRSIKNHHGKARYLIQIENKKNHQLQNIMMNPSNGRMMIHHKHA